MSVNNEAIPDLIFTEAIFRCEITGKMCEDGECNNCIVASYFMSFDSYKLKKILEDME